MAGQEGLGPNSKVTQEDLAEELRQRLDQQEVIAELGLRALSGVELGELIDDAVGRVARTLRVEYCMLLELLPGGEEFLLVAGIGWKGGQVGQVKMRTGHDSQAGFTLGSHEPVIVTDLDTESRFRGSALLLEHGVKSGLSVQIGMPSGVYGVLGAHTARARLFDRHDAHFLQSVANIIGEAVERKRGEEAQSHLAAIVQSSFDAVFRESLEGVITNWNAAAERMYGYSPDEVIGRSVEILFPPELRHTLDDILSTIRRGEHVGVRETVRLRKGGLRIPISLSVSPICNQQGAVIAASTIAHDISDRKRAEEELRRVHDDLEERVEERTRELRDVVKELESFTYAVSHDLRAPLRSIDGFARALEEDYSEELDATALGYLERIMAASRRMGALIDNLLDLSRLDHAPLTFQSVDVTALARRLDAEQRERNPQRNVSLEVEPELKATGDPHLLGIALTNLLDNAWKYTRDRDPGRIEVGSLRQNGQTVYFVSDNGIGFDMRYADRLFVPFQRLHADEVEGTGVGLATVQRIVRRHGGRMWAEGREGEGATFFFTLGSAAHAPASGAGQERYTR
jgi:PAS domain S-box-containing protein